MPLRIKSLRLSAEAKRTTFPAVRHSNSQGTTLHRLRCVACPCTGSGRSSSPARSGGTFALEIFDTDSGSIRFPDGDCPGMNPASARINDAMYHPVALVAAAGEGDIIPCPALHRQSDSRVAQQVTQVIPLLAQSGIMCPLEFSIAERCPDTPVKIFHSAALGQEMNQIHTEAVVIAGKHIVYIHIRQVEEIHRHL